MALRNRWPTAFSQICDQAVLMPKTRLVYIAARVSDIYALLEAAQGEPADLWIRSCQNRVRADGRHLHAGVAATPALGMVNVAVPRALTTERRAAHA